MRNHSYSDYLDDEHFLEVVERYTTKYGNDFEKIKDKISREVASHIYNAHGDQYDINDYISQTQSMLDVLRYINDTINAEVS
ncbi:hypothetical protein UFOVP623_43 [uncultured Caudovirales phage]|uniref:Uncharacterized protein n=1 Tax=uncultured Caudovirales phage TaxID=2100421 RepID=A0A6J5N8H0_9CAUD|nr:hypothetical protein UFOVP623_43 [uncultured Caudovirales phage]